MRNINHFIAGDSTAGSGNAHQMINDPATGKPIAKLQLANSIDVDRAVAAATAAQQDWQYSTLTDRVAILFRFRELLAANVDELAAIITREHGKILSDARGEIGRAREVVEFACGLIEQLKGDYNDQVSHGVDVYSFRQPLGVVVGITPFNFPVMVPMWMSAIAVATGNSFILKPSERDPTASQVLAHLWQEAGLPDGVFNVLQGDKDAVNDLITHDDVDGVSFVGSTPIARLVHDTAGELDKRVQALGGAKNHAVVLADANLDQVAEHLSSAAFGSAGQRCMAISVAVVEESIADELVAKVVDEACDITLAPGSEDAADMGPMITADARERVIRLVGEAEEDGATLALDGRGWGVAEHADGNFIGPTIIDRVTTQMSAYEEEIFGPVLVVVRVPDLVAAVEVINANPYGNGTGLFTASGANARYFKRAVEVGMVGINIPIPVPLAWHSFGGWGDSLFGDHHLNGFEGVSFYTRNKVVTERWPDPVKNGGGDA